MKRELLGKKFQSDHRYAARFREVGGALQEVHRLLREVLRKRDRHRTSTKFRLGVIRRVHEIFKRPSYFPQNPVLNLRSSCKARYKIPHPYKTHKIIIMLIVALRN
jgi:hypothetical protein